MSPDRWSRIKDTFDRALDEPPELRQVFVHSACIHEPELEDEILRLLRANDTSGGFLEDAAGNLHAYLQPQPSGPALQPGTILSRRFEIRNFINSGGMGEVYEAWDADLDEAVALKTILPHIAANPAIIERFKHEVRHAREVSHPNICRVHELFCDESASGTRTWFLSMELLRGITLLECIQTRGSLAASAALPIAAQLISGLETAHARGLVHRDFKSSNVMLLEQDGAPTRAVITDFGLAIGSVPSARLPIDLPGTGTPGYMAPEQARGDAVGPLADQYSFGVVLCDMMTGTLPQASPAVPRTLPSSRQSGYPAVWQTVIHRCTQAEPSARFRDMAAVRSALIPSFWSRRGGWLIAAGLLLVAALAAAMRRHEPPPPIACRICDVTQLTSDTDQSESPSLSGDGRFIAYSSDRAVPDNLDIFVQALASGQLSRVTYDSARDTTPSLSPDGSTVAFRSEREGGGVYLATVGSQADPRLIMTGGRNPKISPDGRSLLYWTGDPDSSIESGKIFRIGLAGGKPQQIAEGFADARYPVWGADGVHVLFTGCSIPRQLLPDCFDWWVTQVSGAAVTQHSQVEIQTHAYAALRTRNFLPGRLNSLDWKNDQVIFSAVGEKKRLSLASITLDAKSFQVAGSPQWLLQGQGGDLDPSVSQTNRIAFTRTSGALHIWRLHGLSNGQKRFPEKITADLDVDGSPFVAEGGRYLVFARGRTLKRAILLRDMTTGEETVIVNLGTPVQSPIIDRAGRWIAYQQTDADGSSAIYAGERGGPSKRICGNCTEPTGWFNGDQAFFFRDGAHSVIMANPRTGQQQVVLKDPGGSIGSVSWSSANHALVSVTRMNAQRQIAMFSLNPTTAQPEGTTVTISRERGEAIRPRWFGDGRGIVYASNQDGFLCIYARPFHRATRTFGEAYPITHFHHQRASIDDVLPRVFNLTADGDTLYLNLGEENSTVELGKLNRP